MMRLQIRIDDNLRIQAQEVTQSMSLDLANSTRMFLTPKADPFYSERNQRVLQESIDELSLGRSTVTASLADLENMAL